MTKYIFSFQWNWMETGCWAFSGQWNWKFKNSNSFPDFSTHSWALFKNRAKFELLLDINIDFHSIIGAYQ